MPEQFQYDVFLSHSSKDKDAVRELARRLQADGLRVWLDEWVIQPGEMISRKVQEGLEQSRTLVLLMSAHAFQSEWATLEPHTALFRDPTNQQRRFIPVRLDDAEVRDALKPFAYVDWRERSEEQYARLLAACRPAENKPIQSNLIIDHKKGSFRSLEGHREGINHIMFSTNGQRIISSSKDGTVCVWNLVSGQPLLFFPGHKEGAMGAALTTNGHKLITYTYGGYLNVWNFDTGACISLARAFPNDEHDILGGICIIPSTNKLATISTDCSLKIWDVETWQLEREFEVPSPPFYGEYFGEPDVPYESATSGADLILSPTERFIASNFFDESLYIWDMELGKFKHRLEGHNRAVESLVSVPTRGQLLSGSKDCTIKLWDWDSGKALATFQGHTKDVVSLAVTPDCTKVFSGSQDGTIKVWEINSGECLKTLELQGNSATSLAIPPNGKTLVAGLNNGSIRVWELEQFSSNIPAQFTRYTNAKVLLVGDSGVGKSGLALRLTEDRFEPTISTDGAAVTRVTDEWATQLKLPHDVSTRDIEREIWLWDFAGQSDYRLVHQLFMDETALAVLVFNPQADNPFEGLGQWDRDLQRAARRPFKKLLVAGRCDRGALLVSQAVIERFRAERGFDAYLETSAQTGAGCNDLREAIIRHIPWAEIPWTASPHIFRLLKEEIVRLKDEGKVLLRVSELKQQLEMRLLQEALQKSVEQNKPASAIAETFKLEELCAVVGLLAGPGAVWQLEFGDFVLLQPERINAYAAAVIRKVRAHPDELGSIHEEDVLAGKLDYQDIQRLPRDEEQIVLRAMHQTFVDHGLCLREASEHGPLLVFPSYFRRERPDLGDHPAALMTYNFSGMLDEIYATLVVRLHHTTQFEKDQLWRFAADFKTPAGQRVGLKMTRKAEGAGEITVYCAPGVAVETQVNFIRYIHDHLKAKDAEVKRTRHYVCGCGTPVMNHETVRKRLAAGRQEILCVDCEKMVPLWDLIEEKFASEETQATVRAMEEHARRAIDNESRELILVGHAFAIAGEAGQIFRPTPNSDWGLDGEIEFKDNNGNASGERVYLQLKSGDSYLETRKDGREVFKLKKPRHAEYWLAQKYPVMLVIRTSDGTIRWMNVTDYLRKHGKDTKQIVFAGEPFTALALWRMRDRVLSGG